MTIVVFDDWKSYIHVLVGIVTWFFPLLLFIYITYEVVEYLYKKRKGRESFKQFVGDFIEFYIGYYMGRGLELIWCNINNFLANVR